jgi:NAD(P)-dependent dehydrogenase (short-subunit alcohol dehydrogenase family)
MLLSGKVAIVYGAAGNVGAVVARTFAAEGATVFLAGRSAGKVKRVAAEIVADGGTASAAEVDSTDRVAVETHLEHVVRQAGRVDISVNATGIDDRQGTPLLEMSYDDFQAPVDTGLRSNFVTGTVVGRQFSQQRSGVILTFSTSACGLSGRDRMFHRTGGFGVACAAIEEFTRSLAAELGRDGVRVVCLRPDALPESWGLAEGEPSVVGTYMSEGTVLGRLPTIQQVADTAAFAASDRAGAMTGAIINLTCGSTMSNT